MRFLLVSLLSFASFCYAEPVGEPLVPEAEVVEEVDDELLLDAIADAWEVDLMEEASEELDEAIDNSETPSK